MKGTHIFASFYDCRNSKALISVDFMKRKLKKIISSTGLSIVGSKFFKFDNLGYTGIFLLSESHIAIHTWPEKNNSLNLDIFVCDFKSKNSDKAIESYKQILNLFNPKKVSKRVIKRK